jgi:6-phosphogluconolactonase
MKRWQNLLIFDDQDQMSGFMVGKWKEISEEAIARRGVFVVALSGGKTPVNFYQTLAENKGVLPWHKTHLFLADERFVPFEDKDSNYRLLRKTLLDKIEIPQENIHPFPTGRSTPEVSARVYEEDLRIFFKLNPEKYPEFDLILLGIGEDGHTASLFPGSPVLKERDALTAAVILDEVKHHRITLTLPVINHARRVVFLVSGKSKASVLEKVVRQKDLSLPASMVNPDTGKLLFLSDSEAASMVTPHEG